MPSHIVRWFVAPMLALMASPLLAQDWSIREPAVDGKNVAAWAKELRNSDPSVRLDAVKKLASLSHGTDAAYPPLISALADPDERVRGKAGDAISESQDEAVRAAVIELAGPLLRSRDPKLRSHGARMLGDSKSPIAAKLLLDAYSDPDSGVRTEIADALSHVPIPTNQERRLLETWLRMERFQDVRKGGPWSPENYLSFSIEKSSLRTDAMRLGIQHAKPHIRLAAVALCPDHPWNASGEDDTDPEKVRPILKRGAADADVSVRALALKVIGQHEAGDMFALAALVKGIRDANPTIRDAATEGLARYKHANPKCLETLMTLTHHERAAVRAAAVKAIRPFADDERKVQIPLLPLFDDPDPNVRKEAVALAIEGRSMNAEIHDALLKAMLDPDQRVSGYACSRAIEVFPENDRKRAADALLQAVREAKPWPASMAARRLAEMKPPDMRAVPIVAERCCATDEYWLAISLTDFGEAGLAALEKAAPRLRPDVAAELLSWIKAQRTTPSLRRTLIEKALESDKSESRRKALNWLPYSQLLDESKFAPETVKNLIRAANDPDSSVRHSVCSVFRHFIPTPQVVQALLSRTKDDDPFVRAAAIRTLGEAGVFPEAVIDVFRRAIAEGGAVGETATQALFQVDLDREELSRLAIEHLRTGRCASTGSWFGKSEPKILAALPHDRLLAVWIERVEKASAHEPAIDELGALLAFGPRFVPAEIAVPLITKLGCHWHPDVRESAIETLGHFGAAARPAVPMLQARCNDPSADVAAAAKAAIAKMR